MRNAHFAAYVMKTEVALAANLAVFNGQRGAVRSGLRTSREGASAAETLVAGKARFRSRS